MDKARMGKALLWTLLVFGAFVFVVERATIRQQQAVETGARAQMLLPAIAATARTATSAAATARIATSRASRHATATADWATGGRYYLLTNYGCLEIAGTLVARYTATATPTRTPTP